MKTILFEFEYKGRILTWEIHPERGNFTLSIRDNTSPSNWVRYDNEDRSLGMSEDYARLVSNEESPTVIA